MNGSSRATPCCDRTFVYGEAVGDVGCQAEHGIGTEQGIGNDQPPVRRVVEAALEPLRGCVHRAVGCVREQSAGQAAQPFGANRVTLVGHGRRTDLIAVERLGEFTDTLQQAQVGAELVACLADAREGGQQLAVLLARIGLAGDRERCFETEAPSNCTIQGGDLLAVALKQGHVAGLGARRTLGAATTERLQPMLDLLEVAEEILKPQAGALADRGELRRLEMGIGQRGRRPMTLGELGQGFDGCGGPPAQQDQSLTKQQDVGVVGNEGTGGTEMENAARVAGLFGKVAQMGHDVVPSLSLELGHAVEIDLVTGSLEGGQLAFVDCQPELLLRRGEG